MAPIVAAVPQEGPSPPQGPFSKVTTNSNSPFEALDSRADPAVDAGVAAVPGKAGTTEAAAKVTRNDNIPVSGIMGVGGRLTHYLKTWIAHGLGDWLTDMLRHGYRLPFRERPPLTRRPSVGSGYNNADKDSALRLVITKLLLKKKMP